MRRLVCLILGHTRPVFATDAGDDFKTTTACRRCGEPYADGLLARCVFDEYTRRLDVRVSARYAAMAKGIK